MPREDQYIDLHFPKAGIDVSRPSSQWPRRQAQSGEVFYSCVDALNVRSYDSISRRNRGGSRPAFSRFIDDQVRGVSYIIQEIGCLVTVGVDPPGGGMAQPSQSGRLVLIYAVAEGYLEVMTPDADTWSSTTNSTMQDPPLNASGIVDSAPNQQLVWFADGLDEFSRYNPATNIINDWILTAGTHPEDGDSNGPRLICTWRGRTIRSGIIGDPQNIFASKVDDPLDYDYSPANPSALDAFALNLSDLGMIGDVVTGLVPSTDDVLVVLCDHTIHKIVGDPLDGGNRDLVCDGIGGAWGKAWCQDPAGRIYFFSNQPGVYVMPPKAEGQPVRISTEIDPILRDVNTGTNTIRLFWDDDAQGIWLFITPTSEEASDPDTVTHWFYEAPRQDGSGNAWFKVRFGDPAMNPLCGVIVDGNEPGDRKLVIGSWDGYARGPDPDATDDDGTPLESYVFLGPLLTKNMDEVKLKSIQGHFAEGSADVDYAIHLGKTAEIALNETVPQVEPRIGTFSASRGYTKRIERSAYSIFIRLGAVGRWAVESLRGVMGHTISKVRGRGNR